MSDEYTRFCCECEYYILAIRKDGEVYAEKFGVCDRVSDPDFCFSVHKDREVCLYQNPGKRISPKEIRERAREALESKVSFEAALKRASAEVASWPKWKQDATRAALEIPRQSVYRK